MARAPGALEVVLSVRRRKEEAQEGLLAAALANLRQAQEAEAALAQRIHELVRRGVGLSVGFDLQHRAELLQAMKRQREQMQAHVKTCEQARDREAETYRRLRADSEVIAELQKQRAAQAHALAQAQERKRIDDLFVSRRTRNAHPSCPQP